MTAIPHKPTKKLIDMAIDWGRTSGSWINFAEQAGIDERVAVNHYRKFWRKGKRDVIAEETNERREMIELMKESVNEENKCSVYHFIGKMNQDFLSKCSPEWSTKQQIEQTNVNIEVPVTDYSKLSKEDKETLMRIRLKAKG